MFTGIIKEVGRIDRLEADGEKREFYIQCALGAEVTVDQSISINGVCHTVTASDEEGFSVQTVAETLRKTAIGTLGVGDPVNLERSIRADQLLDGHVVQGHVDTTGRVTAIDAEGEDRRFTIAYPEPFSPLVVGRGSICVDGVSLTVAGEKDLAFTVAVIPYTYDHTNLGTRSVGDEVNLEFDILGKYVVRYLEQRDRQ